MIPCATENMPALYAALALASGAFLPIAKNRKVRITMKSGGAYDFRYADLEQVIAATRPALSANGLSVIQPLIHVDGGNFITTALLHKDGGALASTVPVPGMSGDPKEYGALITYLRRYAYCSLLSVSADDDLDEKGDGSGGGNRSLAPDRMAFHLNAIAEAANVGELRVVYAEASAEAEKAGDTDAMRRFAKARDAKVAAVKATPKEPA